MSAAKKSAKKATAKKATAKKPPAKKARKSVPAKATGLSLDQDPIFKKVSALALALPDTKLTMTWGSPHFRVQEKIFCGYGSEGGRLVLGVKLQLAHAKTAVKEARFWPAPYVGKHGWVSMDVTQRKSWDEVAELLRESYDLIAPKASRAKLR
jgi:predicted DNA-binding protein (MmcQ/YjbR family)